MTFPNLQNSNNSQLASSVKLPACIVPLVIIAVQHYTAEATSADKAKIWQQRIFGTELNVKTKISLFYTCFGQAWFSDNTHTHKTGA